MLNFRDQSRDAPSFFCYKTVFLSLPSSCNHIVGDVESLYFRIDDFPAPPGTRPSKSQGTQTLSIPVEASGQAAERWLRAAARQRHGPAMLNLALLLCPGGPGLVGNDVWGVGHGLVRGVVLWWLGLMRWKEGRERGFPSEAAPGPCRCQRR